MESTHNVNAIHVQDGATDSLGVCQIKLETAQWLGFRGTREQLMDPETNIYFAAKFLSFQKIRYSGNITKAIIAYNRGNAKNVRRTAYSDRVYTRYNNSLREVHRIGTSPALGRILSGIASADSN